MAKANPQQTKAVVKINIVYGLLNEFRLLFELKEKCRFSNSSHRNLEA